MTESSNLGGTFTPAGTQLTLRRMGYGTMQLPGPGVFGPPRDRDAALATVRDAVRLGVNHIDTSDYYGPYISNEILREALYPYPAGLTIVTKVGARREADKSWHPALGGDELRSQVEDNIAHLGLTRLPIVNLRVGGAHGPERGSIARPLSVLVRLQEIGLIDQIGLSNVTWEQIVEARGMAKIVCIQNYYNVAHRDDDALIGQLAEAGIAYVPFFPLGGFQPLQSQLLDEAAAELGVTSRQVALAWLLQRSPNVLLIPGTSSPAHLRENLAAADLTLPPEVLSRLDRIAVETPEAEEFG
jgi:pyridoxine 4-dehydrogenase